MQDRNMDLMNFVFMYLMKRMRQKDQTIQRGNMNKYYNNNDIRYI